jgi:hypothetical protein
VSVRRVGEILDALVDLSDIKNKGKMKYDPAVNADVEVKEESMAVLESFDFTGLAQFNCVSLDQIHHLVSRSDLTQSQCAFFSTAITKRAIFD